MKKLAAVLIGAALAIPHPCVFAAEDINVSALYVAKENKVVINGRAASGNVIVSITDFADIGNFTKANPPYDMFSVKSDGDFQIKISLNDEAGGQKLSVVITDSEGDMAQTSFMNPDFSSSKGIIANLNNASGVNEFSQIVSDNASNLGIDADDELYKLKKTEVLAVMYAIVKDDAEGPDVYEAYYKSHALVSLKDTTRTEAEEILKSNSPVFGIDYDVDYEDDTRLTDDAKATLCKLLSEADYSKVLSVSESFADFLEKTKAVAAVLSAKTWQDIKEVMEDDFAELFVLTESGTKARMVYSKMMNYSYADFEDIKEGYQKAVESLEEDSRGFSGGSGGFGGSGGAVKLPSSDVIDTINQNVSEGGVDAGENATQKQEMVTLPSSGYSKFLDVPSDHWSYNAVSVLASAGVVSGYPDGSFGVNESITRAEFAKLVCIAFGIPSVKSEFADVAQDAWYNGYVGGGAKYGLINGYGENFGPNDYISRQDAAVIIYRALKNEGIVLSGDAEYDDAIDISLYALTAVGALKEYDIMIGNDFKFFPLSNITRAEAAQLIYKAIFSTQNR